jgi:hypothetical protein
VARPAADEVVGGPVRHLAVLQFDGHDRAAMVRARRFLAFDVANKMARIAFAILRGKTTYREIPT